MPKDKKDSKKKENKKKEKKVSQATKEDVSPEEAVKSIADLFGASSRDPTLEALFKANTGPLAPLRRNVRLQEEDTEDQDEVVNGNQTTELNEQTPIDRPSKKRKRTELDEEAKLDDLEARHLRKVFSQASKQATRHQQPTSPPSTTAIPPTTIQETGEDTEIDPNLLQHESLTPGSTDAEKTLFISNVPTKVLTSKSARKALERLFSPYGHILSMRFRSIAFSELGPRKVAFINKQLHPERDTLNAYIVFEKPESVKTAVEEMNGFIWEEKHLRVDSVSNPTNHDHKRSVFVGNLPFDVQDEDLYSHFSRCGEIEFVRIVRDKKTNIGKGFGYVQFKERDAVDKAVLLHDKPTETIKRKLRVTYAKKEQAKGNLNAARVRLQKKKERSKGVAKKEKAIQGKKNPIEGKRAKKDKSGGSGFKLAKKRGKMRLMETKS